MDGSPPLGPGDRDGGPGTLLGSSSKAPKGPSLVRVRCGFEFVSQ